MGAFRYPQSKTLFERQKQKLITVPAAVYEEFLVWRKEVHPFKSKTFEPTAAEKREVARAKKNFAQGNYTKWSDLKHELGLDFTSPKLCLRF
ncbi:MAG: hypothetical protein AAB415_03485 [Patescibacteria group bacterium]